MQLLAVEYDRVRVEIEKKLAINDHAALFNDVIPNADSLLQMFSTVHWMSNVLLYDVRPCFHVVDFALVRDVSGDRRHHSMFE